MRALDRAVLLLILLFVLLVPDLTAFAQESTPAPTTPAPPPVDTPAVNVPPAVAADTTGWKVATKIGMNFSQSYLSHWASGGKNTVLIVGLAGLDADYQGNAESWENNLDLGYGFTQVAEEKLRKSDDRLFLLSNYSRRLADHLEYSALLDFRTQLTDGYNYNVPDSPVVISRFLAPGVLKLSAGITYTPADYLEIFVAPIANQLTLVLDRRLADAGAFGVDSGKTVKSELGSLLNVLFEKELMTNVALKTRFNAFAPYHDFATMVITWESLLTLKVNEYINASIAADLLYDEKVPILSEDGTVGPRTQFREIFSIGFAYTLK